MTPWSDQFRVDRIPTDGLKLSKMRQDVREAHAWVSRALESATESIRVWNLGQERKRLAAIAWRLKP